MKIYWTIITISQNRRDKAEKLAGELAAQLGNCVLSEIEKYPKFENSWKLILEQDLQTDNMDEAVHLALKSAWSVAQPWTFQFLSDDEFELLFNKTDHSVFRQLSFNVIRWAHILLSV